MAGIKININKTAGNVPIRVEDKDITQEMNERVDEFAKAFLTDWDKFDKQEVFNDILDYIRTYRRILYAPISNMIYACYNDHEAEEAAGLIDTMNINIIAVVNYSQGEVVARRIKTAGSEKEKKDLEDTQKVILKIWDHSNLAQQQYSALKQSDEDYRRVFNNSIAPYKEEMAKEMNAQLLTMVSIFTALAFLIFGGISSLDNIFAITGIPILKLLITGSLWGLCILNLVFVFLFCVGKMTKLSFKSTENENASIFQKYPIVWWSNLIIISILVMSSWLYFLTKENAHSWFGNICQRAPFSVSVTGTAVILGIIIFLICRLVKATIYSEENN